MSLTAECPCRSPPLSCPLSSAWWPGSLLCSSPAEWLYWGPSGSPSACSCSPLSRGPELWSWTFPQTRQHSSPKIINKDAWLKRDWSRRFIASDKSWSFTSSIRSSSISLKTVPLIWFGFRATQLKTGMRNFVLIGFLILTAERDTKQSTK